MFKDQMNLFWMKMNKIVKISIMEEKNEILNFGQKPDENWPNYHLKFVKTCICSSSSGEDVSH